MKIITTFALANYILIFTTLLLCLVFNKSTTHWKIVRRALGEQSREGHLLNL